MQLDPLTLRRAQAGERAAQASFLRACAPPLRALLWRLSATGEREDELQELLITVLRVLPRFSPEGPASLKTWVLAIGHNFVLSRSRKRRLALAPLEEAAQVADGGPATDARLERKQLASRLDAAIARLPEEQRRLFVLAQVHGQPLEEIALAEELPLGTVKSRLHRAKAALVLSLGDALDEAKGDSRAAR